MLQQQINLFNHIEPPRVTLTYLSWYQLCLSNIAVLGLLVIISLFSIFNIFYLKSHRGNLQFESQQLEITFNKRKSTYPAFFFNDNVSQTIGELEKNLGMQEKLLTSLANSLPFSEDMLALSRAIVSSVWLTNIKIEDSGTKIELTGHALAMHSFQDFLKNISKDKTFAGYTLTIDNVDNASIPSKDKKLSFSIKLVKST